VVAAMVVPVSTALADRRRFARRRLRCEGKQDRRSGARVDVGARVPARAVGGEANRGATV